MISKKFSQAGRPGVLMLLPVFLLLAGTLFGAGEKVVVTVSDLTLKKPVEKASVQIVIIHKDNITVDKISGLTNAKGQATFTPGPCEGCSYSVIASKEGLYPVVSDGTREQPSSSYQYTSNPGAEIRLFLDSDPSRLKKQYNEMFPHYPIDSLVMLLAGNRFRPPCRSCQPQVWWNEIPQLLRLGNSTEMITGFPVNPLTSSCQERCQLGVYALWLIESARRTGPDSLVNHTSRFPSMNPKLFKRSGGVSRESDDDQAQLLNTAWHAYLAWWDLYQKKGREAARDTDPLEGTGVAW
jgi:hypothetical protein